MAAEREAGVEVESVDAVEVLYDIALWRLQDQMSQVDSMDRKLAAMFTLTAAVIALFTAGLALRETALDTEAWALLIVVVAVFAANVVSSFLAYRERDWHLNPRLEDMENVAQQSGIGEKAARYWAAIEMRKAVYANEVEMRAKRRWLRVSHGLMALDLLLAAITVVVVTAPIAG